MAQITLSAYMAELAASPAPGAVTATQFAVESGTIYGASIAAPGKTRFVDVNTPGRDITLQDFRSGRIMRNVGLGSTPLMLRPLPQIANSPSDPTLAGLTGAITDTEKFHIRLRKEYDGFFSVNPFTPTNKGAVANQAAMTALSSVSKYDYCQRLDLSGAYYIFTGTNSAIAAQWQTEGAAGFTHGTPAVVINWGDNNVNDPQFLSSGHAPVALVYWKTAGNIDYWGT